MKSILQTLPLDPDSVFVVCRIIKVEASVQLWLITLTETSRLFQISQKLNPIICFLTHCFEENKDTHILRTQFDIILVYILHKMRNAVACENIRFSSLFTHEDVSHRRTSVTQRQKFHTDHVKSVWNPVRSADWSTE